MVTSRNVKVWEIAVAKHYVGTLTRLLEEHIFDFVALLKDKLRLGV
jgi:hypothetical protein